MNSFTINSTELENDSTKHYYKTMAPNSGRNEEIPIYKL